MRQVVTLEVGPDGRVAIPDTRPGQIITIHVADDRSPTRSQYATLATARTDDEKAAVVTEIKRLAGELRQELGLGEERLSILHGDLLYDESLLPR